MTSDTLDGGFSRRVLAWIVTVAAGSFLLAVLVTAFAGELGEPPNPGPNSLSRSALGFRALTELLRAREVGVLSRQGRSGGGAGPFRPLVLAVPDLRWLRENEPHRLAALRKEALASDAVLVLVLPKWKAETHSRHPGWLEAARLLSPYSSYATARALAPGLEARVTRREPGAAGRIECTAHWRSQQGVDFRPELSPAQLLEPAPGLEPEVVCGGGLLVARHQLGPSGPELYLVADPDLLSNHGLARGDNAALVHELFTRRLGARGVIFDETVHGLFRSRGVLAEAVRYPLVLATVQGALLLAVVLWAGMGRFGKPRRAPLPGEEGGKTVLIDNTARLLTVGGHAADSLERYARQTIRAVAARLFLPADLPDGERLARLERISRGRRSAVDLRVLAWEVEHFAGRNWETRTAAERATALARELYLWRQEMMDGHREHP